MHKLVSGRDVLNALFLAGFASFATGHPSPLPSHESLGIFLILFVGYLTGIALVRRQRRARSISQPQDLTENQVTKNG